MTATQLISIVNDEVVVRLSPIAIAKIDQDRLQNPKPRGAAREILYKLDSSKLLQVLASSLGIASLRQGAIIIWTYFEEESRKSEDNQAPILRTLITIDGDLTQKIRRDILEHPSADRLFKVHNYLIGQISQQLTTAIADYVAQKIRPIEIALVTFTAAIVWNDQVIAISQRLNFPQPLINILASQFSSILITIVAVVLWRLSSLKVFPMLSQRAIARLFSNLQLFLENSYLQFAAIAAVCIFMISSIALTQEIVSPDTRTIINELKQWTEIYLPVALICLRKLIIRAIGKIFLRIPFLMKLIFGRFIR
ncbi:MAG: hypothetical protein DCE90_00875 [Pseudanabaena sp.]|nr:MAG: hypothetical protein DCE90_00875 [Pseudanabaena sp.]